MANAVARGSTWHPTSREDEFKKVSDYFCPECGGTSRQIGSAHWQCDNCGKRFVVEPTVLHRYNTSSLKERGLLNNPYNDIPCIDPRCHGTATKIRRKRSLKVTLGIQRVKMKFKFLYQCTQCNAEFPPRYPDNWSEVRKVFLPYFGYRCICGASVWYKPAHFHHQRPMHPFANPWDYHHPTNIVLLCEEHHLELHPERAPYYHKYYRHHAPTTRRKSYRRGGYHRRSSRHYVTKRYKNEIISIIFSLIFLFSCLFFFSTG